MITPNEPEPPGKQQRMHEPEPGATNGGAEAPRPKKGRMPFGGLDTRFLRRTVVATLITLALVAMTVTVYWSPAWAGYYLFAGVWALVFLSLTPLILKFLLFERRPLPGLALIAVKLGWLMLMFAVGLHWQKTARPAVLGSALVAGVVTPLLVVVLRAVGAALEAARGNGRGVKQGMNPKL